MAAKDITALSALFTTSGVIHLVKPEVFEGIIPGPLKSRKRELVVWSGVAELGCAALMLVPRTRRLGGLLSVGLLAGVFPANAQMTLDAFRNPKASTGFKAGTVARLPMQWPMIRVAWRAARGR